MSIPPANPLKTLRSPAVATGITRLVITDSKGSYRFGDINAGDYSVTVRAPNFKAEIQTGIVVLAQETHSAGTMTLQAGSAVEITSVVAPPAVIQSAGSGKAFDIDTTDIENITQKGRDLMGYLRLLPGVVDTQISRDVPSSTAIQGIHIDGNTSAINVTVDGINDLDTRTNRNLDVEPNLDAVREMNVLEADYGRNTAAIQVASSP